MAKEKSKHRRRPLIRLAECVVVVASCLLDVYGLSEELMHDVCSSIPFFFLPFFSFLVLSYFGIHKEDTV
jgi:hypothetical protein